MYQSLKTLSISAMMSVCITAYAHAQEGIRFNNQGAFKEVLAESSSKGKLIFMDCYTSWCGPCKWMEQNVFINDSVSAFYNTRFVNYKMDMEKGEGPELAKRYGVKVFPTYLFLNGKGEVVHKATSRMEVAAFLEEAERALDPKRSFTAVEKAFNEGNRSHQMVLNYAVALKQFNRERSDSVSRLLVAQLKDKELLSPVGWETMQQFNWSEEDRLGKYFLKNKAAYAKKYGVEPVRKVQDRLTSSALYGLMRRKDSIGFFTRIAPWQQSPNLDQQKKAIQMEADYYLGSGNVNGFIRVTDAGLKGPMKDDDMMLGYIARRSQNEGRNDKRLIEQAYKLAKRTVAINPEEYSNQSTFAKACQAMGYKEEALKAAEKTYELALKETSKIVGFAQKLLDEVKAM